MEKRKQSYFRPDPRTWLLFCLLGIASILLVHSEIGGLCLFLGCLLIHLLTGKANKILPYMLYYLGGCEAAGQQCGLFCEFYAVQYRDCREENIDSLILCHRPCRRSYRLPDGGFAGHAFPKGCRDSGCGSFTIFPNDLRGIPGHPFFPAVSGDWGRRGSHAYPSSFYSGIYLNPADFEDDKGGRRTIRVYDGARRAFFR